jgi:hypothetical protein
MLIFGYPEITTSLAFDGSAEASVFDDKLALISGFGQEQNSHTLSLYGLGLSPDIELFPSDMTEERVGDSISSSKVELTPVRQPTIITHENPKIFTFSLSDNVKLQPGVYQGALFVRDGADITSTPITLDARPGIAQPTILVIDGIVISIAFWKLITYLNARYSILNGANLNLRQLQYERMRTNLGSYVTDKSILIKGFILDAGTILFGIALGIIALPTDEFINSLHAIGPYEALILIGIGLGIGSLKEFLPKT